MSDRVRRAAQGAGPDLRTLPLAERKAWLHQHVTPRPGLQLVESIEVRGDALFALAVDQDFEGIVAKRLDAPYAADPQSCWLKIKNASYSRKEALTYHAASR